MNTNRRISKLTVEQVARIKIMLHFGIMGQEIAKQFAVSPETISKIAIGKYWKDVKVDFSNFAAGPCIGCGKLLIDGIDELIYLVAEDAYACGQECIEIKAEL